MNIKKTLHNKIQALVIAGGAILQAAVMAGLLSACSGGGGSAAANDPAAAAAAAQGVGGIQVAGRLSGADVPPTGTPWPAATPDDVTLNIDEVAVSTDGVQYTTVLQGPIQFDLTDADGGIIPGLDQLPATEYKALRLKVDTVTWHATWTVTNPSPCDTSTTGQGTGTVALGGHKFLYFMTPSLGGNTLRHYLTKLPITDPNYIGDANNPFLLASPLVVSKDNVSTLSLVLGTSGTLTCSTVTAMDNQGTPTLTLAGDITQTEGVSGIAFNSDSGHDDIAVANTTGNSITVYHRDTLATSSDGNILPGQYITGPDTRLNLPRGIAVYHDPNPSNDEMIVANSGNDSLTVYNITADGDAAPVRTIAGGQHTNLSTPVGVAIWTGAASNKDELWVANNGSDTVTVYPRIDFGDPAPLYTLSGSNTNLSAMCGIAISSYTDSSITPATSDDYVLVTNNVHPGTTLGSDSVTIYLRSNIAKSIGYVANTSPTYTIGGDQTGLNKPGGITVDSAANEIYVANAGNNTVTVYDWTQLVAASTTNTGDNNIAPVRTITGLNSPQGAFWDATHGQLWVTQRGQQAAMTSLPDMTPVASDTDSAGAPIQGKYNIIVYGVDLSKGTHNQGSTIPILYTERGTATFNTTTGTAWASLVVNVDDSRARQIMEPGCQISIHPSQSISGIYDVDSKGNFHAFLKDQRGSLSGAFDSNGDMFTATAFDNPSRMYVMFGVRDTGTAAPNLAPGGGTSTYTFARYVNQLTLNRFSTSAISKNDTLTYESDLGGMILNPTRLVGMAVDSDGLTIANPMGDYAAPTSGGSVMLQRGDANTNGIAMTAHAGGQLEIEGTGFGLAGAASANGDTMLMMGDTNVVDNNSCPTTLGYSIALRSSPSLTDADIKGTYYVAAMGDAGYIQTQPARATYRLSNGTITFDGKGGGQLTLADSDEGDIQAQDQSFTYVLRNNVSLPSNKAASSTSPSTIVDLYKAAGDLNPIASVVVGNGGDNLLFYENLATKDASTGSVTITGNPSRLIGFAIHRNP